MVASPCSLLRTTVYLHHTVSHDVTDVLFDFFLKTYLQTDQPTYISRSIYALLLHRSIKSELKISQEQKDHQENKILKWRLLWIKLIQHWRNNPTQMMLISVIMKINWEIFSSMLLNIRSVNISLFYD